MKILQPTDFSKQSKIVVRYAVKLVKKNKYGNHPPPCGVYRCATMNITRIKTNRRLDLMVKNATEDIMWYN